MRGILIYNQSSGQIWNWFNPESACEFLNKSGWDIKLERTLNPEDGTKVARIAVEENMDVVIGAGGDGTLNAIIQGLAGSNVKLGVLPVGTTNVLARELNIPLNSNKALELLLTSQPVDFDLGMINNHYFILMVGVGFDANIVHEVDPTLKQMTGIFAFITATTKTFFQHKPSRMKIIMIDKNNKKKTLRRLVYQISISNVATYGNNMIIASDAKYDDGLMEVNIFRGRRIIDTLFNLLAIAVFRKKEWSASEHYSVKSIEIKSFRKIPIQVDGEPITHTPAKIIVKPKFLQVLKPPELDS